MEPSERDIARLLECYNDILNNIKYLPLVSNPPLPAFRGLVRRFSHNHIRNSLDALAGHYSRHRAIDRVHDDSEKNSLDRIVAFQASLPNQGRSFVTPLLMAGLVCTWAGLSSFLRYAIHISGQPDSSLRAVVNNLNAGISR